MKHSYVRAVLISGGIFYVIVALTLLFAPVWFFETIGNYAPYNRHYEGDAGSFSLIGGLVLLWAARDIFRYRAMIAIVGIGSLVHALNHVVDDFILNPSTFSMMNNVTLFVFAFAILLAAYWAVPELRTVKAKA